MRSAFAVDCPSRHYCHTAEVKYRAFNELPGAYLNSTSHLLKTFSANTSRNCMQECTRTENCQSANYYSPVNASEMSCDLIDGNKWSNASLLVKRENSTHFFIKVQRGTLEIGKTETIVPSRSLQGWMEGREGKREGGRGKGGKEGGEKERRREKGKEGRREKGSLNLGPLTN